MPRKNQAALCIILALLICLLPGGGAQAKAKAFKQPSVTVTGQASLTIAPDQAQLTIGVISQAASAIEASKLNAQQMTQVLEAVKAKLGAGDNLRTLGYSLHPRSRWDPKTKQNQIQGYEARNRFMVTTGDIDGLAGIFEAAAKAGANSINGPTWSLKNPVEAKVKAQKAAFDNAVIQAKSLAMAAGRELGPVLRITATAGSPPRPMLRAARATMAMEAGPAPPMEPGEIQISTTVTCVFALVKAP
jgi:uncharacterized protein YggE